MRRAMDFDGSRYEVINLGNSRTVSLAELVSGLEEVPGVQAKLDRRPEEARDVPQTWADVSKAKSLLSYEPRTEFRDGLRRFHQWFTATASGHGEVHGLTPDAQTRLDLIGGQQFRRGGRGHR
jgi:UDP-glucuronate 4-epimerase